MALIAPYLPPNPLRPRAYGGKGAEGVKKGFPSNDGLLDESDGGIEGGGKGHGRGRLGRGGGGGSEKAGERFAAIHGGAKQA
jgi:hypothetical protein